MSRCVRIILPLAMIAFSALSTAAQSFDNWTQAIPGHGGVQPAKAQLEKLVAFMKDVVPGVQAAAVKNLSLGQAKTSIDLSKHASNFPNFNGGSVAMVERAWAEVTGKILD